MVKTTPCRILCLHGYAMKGGLSSLASAAVLSDHIGSVPSSPDQGSHHRRPGGLSQTPPLPGTSFDEYLQPLRRACHDAERPMPTTFVTPSAPHWCTAQDPLLQRILQKHNTRLGATPSPSSSTTPTIPQDQETNYRCWWKYRGHDKTDTNEQVDKKTHRREMVGLEESLDFVKAMILNQNYPIDDNQTSSAFDGILGYSQGGVLASFLCSDPAVAQRIQFVILVGTFWELAANAPPAQMITVPSLHVIGKADRVVPPAWSQAHVRHYANATVYEHGGGHVVPAEAEFYRVVQNFVRASLR